MELNTYLTILWKRKIIIVLTLVAAVVVTVVGMQFITPIYQASTIVRLATVANGSADWLNHNLQYTDRLLNTYAELATSEAVQTELTERLKSEEQLAIEVNIFANTELMEIRVAHSNPTLATNAVRNLTEILVARSEEFSAETARDAEEMLVDRLSQLEQELRQARTEYFNLIARLPENSSPAVDDLLLETKREQYERLLVSYEQTQLREALQTNTLSVVTPAVVPNQPAQPNQMLTLLLGLLVGGVGSVGLAFVVENLDTRLYTIPQIQTAAGLPILGEVPNLKKGALQEESFSYLCATVIAALPAAEPRALLITSAEPAEGKSTVASHLAIAIAQTGRTVALVDGDLRLPVLHSIFSLPNEAGLSTILQNCSFLPDVLQTGLVPGLRILPSGPLPDNPSALLALPSMAALVQQLRQQFDVVLFDSPALLAVADAALLAPQMDDVILVTKYGQVRQETLQAVHQRLRALGAPLTGLVVNGVALNRNYRRYYRRKHKSPPVNPYYDILPLNP